MTMPLVSSKAMGRLAYSLRGYPSAVEPPQKWTFFTTVNPLPTVERTPTSEWWACLVESVIPILTDQTAVLICAGHAAEGLSRIMKRLSTSVTAHSTSAVKFVATPAIPTGYTILVRSIEHCLEFLQNS